MEILKEISEKVEKGKAQDVKLLVTQSLEQGINPQDVLNQGLVKGMEKIGEKFKNNEVFIPEVLIAARAMKQGMEILKPHLAKSNFKAKGKICIGTVKGDLHDIGKNIVCMMFEGAGFEVVDLGIDVSKEKFIESAKNEKPDILGMSALLTTTMIQMKEIIDELNRTSLPKRPIVLIGGAPITQSYADEIKADGYAPDAASAVDVAKRLLKIA